MKGGNHNLWIQELDLGLVHGLCQLWRHADGRVETKLGINVVKHVGILVLAAEEAILLARPFVPLVLCHDLEITQDSKHGNGAASSAPSHLSQSFKWITSSPLLRIFFQCSNTSSNNGLA
jgi:hypothetical protein